MPPSSSLPPPQMEPRALYKRSTSLPLTYPPSTNSNFSIKSVSCCTCASVHGPKAEVESTFPPGEPRILVVLSGLGPHTLTFLAMSLSFRKKSSDAWLSPPSDWMGSTMIPATVLFFFRYFTMRSSTWNPEGERAALRAFGPGVESMDGHWDWERCL